MTVMWMWSVSKYLITNLITDIDTKWLTVGEHTQRGEAGQMDDSPKMAGDLITLLKSGVQFKTYKMFLSGISNLIFLDCGWPQVTKSTKKWNCG